MKDVVSHLTCHYFILTQWRWRGGQAGAAESVGAWDTGGNKTKSCMRGKDKKLMSLQTLCSHGDQGFGAA